jgi:D-amino-acid dehydrogenase
MALYDRLIAAGVEFQMARSGVLRVFLGKENMEASLRELMRRPDGAEQVQVLDRQALLAAHPILAADVAGGFLIKGERHVRPETLTAGLARHLRMLGVEMHTGLAVIGLERVRGRVKAIITERGAIEADSILITMGAWSGRFLKGVGVRIPMLAAKGYSITVRNPALRLSCPFYLVEAKIACSPYADALRIAGTVELSNVDGLPTPRRLSALRRATRRWLGDWEHGAHTTSWMGMRPVAPDGLPLIGPVPGFENLHIATGHAKLGMTLAPATAVAVADLIVGGTSAVDLRPFHPGRFQ